MTMTEELTEFNPFEYMDSCDEVYDFLQACEQDDDPQTLVVAMSQLKRWFDLDLTPS